MIEDKESVTTQLDRGQMKRAKAVEGMQPSHVEVFVEDRPTGKKRCGEKTPHSMVRYQT
jgi:hypothetical protein